MGILEQGVMVTLFAMAIVFAGLVVLMILIKFQTRIFSGNKEEVKKERIINSSVSHISNASEKVEKTVVKEEDDLELVAAIMAAISLYTNMDSSEFVIKSIKRVSGNESNWRRAGLN